MLNTRRLLIKVCMAALAITAALAVGGPETQAAATIVVDDVTPADNCGKYDGDAAETDPAVAISDAASGSTIVICPGTYNLNGDISVSGVSKLTIKRALTGPGDTPRLVGDPVDPSVAMISDSTGVTIDGVIFDGTTATFSNYSVIDIYTSDVTLKHVAIIGPDKINSRGINADSGGSTKIHTVSISDSTIAGFTLDGIYAQGPVKLAITDTHIDSQDGGRIPPASTTLTSGIQFDGATADTTTPTGSVKGSHISADMADIYIRETSNVSIADNILFTKTYGVFIATLGLFHGSDNNTISGNTILGVEAGQSGVYIIDQSFGLSTTLKTTISGNSIVASRYAPAGTAYAIYVYGNGPDPTTVTATISKNSFFGFALAREINNAGGGATLTSKDNTDIP